MSAPLNLNRERLTVLRAIRDGDVYLSPGGFLLRRVPEWRGGARVGTKVRELAEAGYVEMVDGLPHLTLTGKAVAAQ